METSGVLDPNNELDQFVLQYVFLQEFASTWNHHPMRMERNWSPKKVWLNRVLDPQCSTQTAIRDIVEGVTAEGMDTFGIGFGGAIPEESSTTVEVPDTVPPLEVEVDYFED